MRQLVIILSAGALFISCQKDQYLTGVFSREEFISKCEWKHKVNQNYQVDEDWRDSLKSVTEPVDVRIYLGTWCSDSRKWIPRFFAIQPLIPVDHLEIIAVDSAKIENRWRSVKDQVEKVPSILFLRKGKEVGRITEKPRKKLEKAIFEIIRH